VCPHHLQGSWNGPRILHLSSREDENLPILKDAVNWLQLGYSLAISVVRSDCEKL